MNDANRIAFEKLVKANPVLIGCELAGKVIPNFKKNLIIHSGPDVPFAKMRGPHKKGVVGAALFEKLAKTEAEAIAMIEKGEIELAPANDYNSGAPGSGITSYSMGMLVVREANSGIVAYAPPIEGPQGGGLGGWGVYNEAVDANLREMAGRYLPALDAALKACGGVNVAELFAEGLQMGDDEHTRQYATDRNFISKLLPTLGEAELDDKEKIELLRWLASCNRFVHHIGCASAVAALKSAMHVPGSSLVCAMCGNGVEFGIKTSGTGEKWFIAPAPTFSGHYFSPESTDADAAPWLGDSSNVEAWGLGGMAAAAAPALLAARNESLTDGIAQCDELAKICFGRNERFFIPELPAKFAPAGILPELAVKNAITPKMHGGILSRVTGGQIGVGYARTPLGCFEKAVNHAN